MFVWGTLDFGHIYIIFISPAILLGFCTCRITVLSVILTVRMWIRGFLFHLWLSIHYCVLNQALLEDNNNKYPLCLPCYNVVICLSVWENSSAISSPKVPNISIVSQLIIWCCCFVWTPVGSFCCRHYSGRKVDAINFNKQFFKVIKPTQVWLSAKVPVEICAADVHAGIVSMSGAGRI